jgi:cation-transporting P-type ATPase 13A2
MIPTWCETNFSDILFVPVRKIPYPYRSSTVFPGYSASTKVNGNGSSSINSEGLLLEDLLLIDYRYAKFALDPTSGTFSAVKCARRSLGCLDLLLICENRDWRDNGWTGVGSVKNGLEGPLRQQRLTLFGPNIIDIEGKSVISLLVDEVSFALYVSRNSARTLG